MKRIVLQVPFSDKHRAVSLGAKYDSVERCWFITEKQNFELFRPWLVGSQATYQSNSTNSIKSASQHDQLATSLNRQLLTKPALPNTYPAEVSQLRATAAVSIPDHPIGLSEFLSQIETVIHTNFRTAAWIVAEIGSIKWHSSGHVYLSLVERDPNDLNNANNPNNLKDSKELARVQAYIWRSQRQILKKFAEQTGQTLCSAMTVLIKVEPQFHRKFGLSLHIQAIDAKFSLGVMIQRTNLIRKELLRLGVAQANKEIKMPPVLTRIAIICPFQAAAKGDFEHVIHPLLQEKLIEIDYFECLFQGDQSKHSIIRTLQEVQSSSRYQLVCLIRGGGAIEDLQYLEQFELLHMVCKMPIPVWVGIGHQMNQSLLDWVAHRSLITPTAVAQAIIESVLTQLRVAINQWCSIQQTVLLFVQQQWLKLNDNQLNYKVWLNDLRRKRVSLNFNQDKLLMQTKQVLSWHSQSLHSTERSIVKIQVNMESKKLDLNRYRWQIKHSLALRIQHQRLLLTYPTVKPIQRILTETRQQLEFHWQQNWQQFADHIQQAIITLQTNLTHVQLSSQQHLHQNRSRLKTLSEIVENHQPQRILNQGYALISTLEGQSITRSGQIKHPQTVLLRWQDGVDYVRISPIKNLPESVTAKR